MAHGAKRIVLAALAPVAACARLVGDPLRRVWAHARFAAQIDSPLDPSVVILGVPEIHGTGRIACGRNLYLYRDLYLETHEAGRIEIGDDVVL